MRKKIIFLVGPTAVGKTKIAMSLAKKINAEIIACDSMQVYKGLDILSSKPPLSLQKKVRHHLLDVVLPEDEFSVAAYRKLAIRALQNIHKRHKVPLFVGGTGLYMSVVIDGIFKDVGKDEILRREFYKLGERLGNAYLYQKLSEVDKEAALKIHPNDLKRIIRALEVYQLTGKPISELKKKRRGLGIEYDIRIFGLNKERQDLYCDINQRVEEMFAQGLVREVRGLLKHRLSQTCRQAIGIKEVAGYLNGDYSLDKAKELIKKNTRSYAKRQLTWFNKDKRILWLNSSKEAEALRVILREAKA